MLARSQAFPAATMSTRQARGARFGNRDDREATSATEGAGIHITCMKNVRCPMIGRMLAPLLCIGQQALRAAAGAAEVVCCVDLDSHHNC